MMLALAIICRTLRNTSKKLCSAAGGQVFTNKFPSAGDRSEVLECATLDIRRFAPRATGRLVLGYGMIGTIGIPNEYGRYMHPHTYSMHIC